MKLNCLIVDDEPLAIKVLEAHIANIPSLTCTCTCMQRMVCLLLTSVIVAAKKKYRPSAVE